MIKRSYLALREGQSVCFGCHALYGFLHRFQEPAFTVKDILSQIEREDILLPQTVTGLLKLLSALNDKELLLLLKDTSEFASSWVIFRKDELLCQGRRLDFYLGVLIWLPKAALLGAQRLA